MQFSITFRHMEPSEHLKDYARDKLSKLEKYLNSVMVADVTLSIEKFRHKAEAIITADGLKIKAEEETEDMYSSVDILLDKIERQVKRSRNKLKDHKAGQNRRAVRQEAGPEQPKREPQDDERHPEGINRVRHISLLELSPHEAVERMLHAADELFMFIDVNDGLISVVYQRPDGQNDLIKPKTN